MSVFKSSEIIFHRVCFMSYDISFIISQALKDMFIINFEYYLTHFSPVSNFYTPWKRQKTKVFLTFSGVIEMWH